MKIYFLPLWLCLTAYLLHAEVFFSEDFSNYEPGVLPETKASLWQPRKNSENDNGKTLFSRVEADTEKLFGSDPANRYLRLTNSGAGPNMIHNVGVVGRAFGSLGKISFKFYTPSQPASSGRGYIFRFGTNMSNDFTAFALGIQNGGLYGTSSPSILVDSSPFAKYELDHPHALVIIYNTTASDVTYDTDKIISPNTMDVWLDGKLVGKGLHRSGGLAEEANTSLKSFSFTEKDKFTGTLLVDDILIDNDLNLSPAK